MALRDRLKCNAALPAKPAAKGQPASKAGAKGQPAPAGGGSQVRVRFAPSPTGNLHVGGGAHGAVQLAVR